MVGQPCPLAPAVGAGRVWAAGGDCRIRSQAGGPAPGVGGRAAAAARRALWRAGGHARRDRPGRAGKLARRSEQCDWIDRNAGPGADLACRRFDAGRVGGGSGGGGAYPEWAGAASALAQRALQFQMVATASPVRRPLRFIQDIADLGARTCPGNDGERGAPGRRRWALPAVAAQPAHMGNAASASQPRLL